MQKVIIGWKEWCSLPELGIPLIKAKIDTGAKTSCLHAFNIKPFKKDGTEMIKFQVHPIQYRKDIVYNCVSSISDQRTIIDSGSHKENRFIIKSEVVFSRHNSIKKKIIEISLTNRINMSCRMLIGREALAKDFIVDSDEVFLLGSVSRSKIKSVYKL